MSLIVPRNIGGAPNAFAETLAHLQEFKKPTGHIIDGTFCGAGLAADELPGVACGLTACSFIYVCEPRGLRVVAGFVVNELLRHAKLGFLIDDQEPGSKLPDETASELCVYIRCLFKQQRQIDSVGIPGDHAIEPTSELAIERGQTTVVSLADIKHRPQSSRDSS